MKLDEYIVIRCPSNLQGNPVSIVHIVITRKHLSLYIDKFFDNKIVLDKNIYPPIALFNYIIKHRRTYTFIDAVCRAKYLNKQKYERRNN